MHFLKSMGWGLAILLSASFAQGNTFSDDMYVRHIQPIFESRCIACHSCFNAPCQLNLQSFEGFERGANKSAVYNGSRTKMADPTRMGIDAHSKKEWLGKGFFELHGSPKLEENLFYAFLKQRVQSPNVKVDKQVVESLYCPSSLTEFQKLDTKIAEQLGMPYGFPQLNAEEMRKVEEWIKIGSPRSKPAQQVRTADDKASLGKSMRAWENFLNSSSKENQLVSRYIYEHLFLGHLYFSNEPQNFFRLVRSKKKCDQGIEEIGTRRPNDDPMVKKFYYCLRQVDNSIVAKTHIPFELNEKKLSRYKDIFWAEKWKVNTLPSYQSGIAENPFIAFQDIPAKARYQFLLEDAHFYVNTFIRGPVCNGSMAVNSIQEQFFVFFLSPDADNTVLSKEYDGRSKNLLMLPGVWGSDVEIQQTPAFISKVVEHREAYRLFRDEWKKKLRPEGYSLEDIWDGYKVNDNAVLTVFRHDDNAAVLKGAVGDLSKTAFVLDYPLFERLVYNLVVNFDVFGNIGHQLLTRQYMDFIRMEAEELFLDFLPSEDRVKYRKEWYRGLLTQAKMTYVFPNLGVEEPSAVKFKSKVNTKKQLVESILFQRMNEPVRGSLDPLNWKNISVPAELLTDKKTDPIQTELRKIASVKAVKATPFARYFSDFSLLKVRLANGEVRVFSLIHNREHENISWILAESLRFAPEEDSLTVHEGIWGAYPNTIYDVSEAKLKDFVTQVQKVKSESAYKKLKKEYAVNRSRSDFWFHYDVLTAHYRKVSPIDFGFLDLTRFDLD